MADEVILRIGGDSRELQQAVAAATTSLRSFNVEVGRMGTGTTGAQRNLAGFSGELGRVSQGVRTLEQASQQIQNVGNALTGVGTRAVAGFTVPIVGGLYAASKASRDFESAFSDVTKTIDTTGIKDPTPLFNRLNVELRQMAKEIPESAEDLSHLASIGAQFGISNDYIIDFTRNIAALGVAVEGGGLTAESAAEGLAQLRNITRESEKDIQRMASSLTALGNTGASSEAQILDFSQRIAGAGKEIHLTTPEIMALGSTLASVGLNAEAGGTAISRTLTQMQNAVEQGGDKLAAFARISQVSSEQFAETFRTKPLEAIRLFISGLQTLKDSGESVAAALGDVGAESIRQVDTLRRASGAMALLDGNLKTANQSWEAQNAHLIEASRRYETTNRQITLFFNRLKEAARIIGDDLNSQFRVLLGSTQSVTEGVEALAHGFVNLPTPIKLAIEAGLGIAAITPVAVLLTGQIALAVNQFLELRKAMIAMREVELAGAFVDAGAGVASMEGNIAKAIGTTVTWTGAMLSTSKTAGTLSQDVQVSTRGLDAALAVTNGEFGKLANRFREGSVDIRDVFKGTVKSVTESAAEMGLAIRGALAVTGPIALVVAAIGSIIFILHELTGSWETTFNIMFPPLGMLKKGWNDLQQAIKDNKPTIEATKSSFDSFMRGAKEADDALGDSIRALKGLGQAAIDAVNPFKNDVPKAAKEGADAVTAEADRATAESKARWEGYWNWWRSQFAWIKEQADLLDASRDPSVTNVGAPKPPPSPGLFQVEGPKRIPQARQDEAILDREIGATKARNQAIEEGIKLNRTYHEDLARVGVATFNQAIEEHTRYGRALDKLAEKYHVSVESLERYKHEISETGKATAAAERPVTQLRKQLTELDTQLALAFQTLTDRELADQFGEQMAKMAKAAKAMGLSLSADFKKAQAAIDSVNRTDLLADIRKDIGAANEVVIAGQQDLDDQVAENTKKTALDLVEITRQTSRDRQAIWMTESDRIIFNIRNWGEDLKRTLKGTVNNFDEFSAAIDAQVSQRIIDATMQTKEFGLEFGRVSAAVPMGLSPIGLFLKDTGDKTKKAKEETKSWTDSLDDVSRAFAQLAEVSGGTFGGVLKELAQIISLMNVAAKAGDQLGAAWTAMNKEGAGTMDKIGAGVAAAGAVVQGASAIAAATDRRGRGNRALAGAGTGAAIGANPALMAATGGASVIVGAAIGAVAGALRSPLWEKVANGIGRDLGIKITDELAKTIAQQTKAKFGGSREAAVAFNLDKIIEEGGGLSESNIDKLTENLRNVFSIVDRGGLSVKDAQDTLNRTFPMFAAYMEQSGHLYSEKFREIIRLNNDMKVKSAEIAAFVAKQSQQAGADLGKIFQPLKIDATSAVEQMKKVDEAAQVLRDKQKRGDTLSSSQQRELDRLDAEWDKARDKVLGFKDDVQRAGVLITSTFANALASGRDYASALADVLPAVEDILPAYEQLKKLGVDVGNSFLDQIINESKLVEAHRDLVDSMSAVNSFLKASSSLGKVTQEQFDALAGSVDDTAKRMLAAGFSNESVLRQMLPFLQEAIELHNKEGVAIDATTQKYIDQARQAGLSLDKQKTETEILQEGFDNVNLGLAALIETLGGKVPEALRNMGKAAKDATTDLGGINQRLSDVRRGFDDVAFRGTEALGLIARRARDTQAAVDGITYGHSPGGLKDIPPHVKDAEDAFAAMYGVTIQRLRAIEEEVTDPDKWQAKIKFTPVDKDLAHVFGPVEKDLSDLMARLKGTVQEAGSGPVEQQLVQLAEQLKAMLHTGARDWVQSEIEHTGGSFGPAPEPRAPQQSTAMPPVFAPIDVKALSAATEEAAKRVEQLTQLATELAKKDTTPLPAGETAEDRDAMREDVAQALTEALAQLDARQRDEESGQQLLHDLMPSLTGAIGGAVKGITLPAPEPDHRVGQMMTLLQDSLQMFGKAQQDQHQGWEGRESIGIPGDATGRGSGPQTGLETIIGRMGEGVPLTGVDGLQKALESLGRTIDRKGQEPDPRTNMDEIEHALERALSIMAPQKGDIADLLKFAQQNRPTTKADLLQGPNVGAQVSNDLRVQLGRMKPSITLNVNAGAFQQKIDTWALGRGQTLVRDFIAPELHEAYRSGGDHYAGLATLVEDIVRDKGL